MAKNRREHKKRQQKLLSLTLSDDEDTTVTTGGSGLKRMKQDKHHSKVNVEEDTHTVEREFTEIQEYEDVGIVVGLPIVGASGKWKLTKRKAIKKDGQDGQKVDEESEDDHESSSKIEDSVTEKTFEEVKREIGTLAVAITEDTEENIGKLREIMSYCDSTKYNLDINRLAMLSTWAVLKDILPGYYIRPLSEAERKTTVSKDIRKMRSFEESILNSYKKYFDMLKAIIQPHHRNKKIKLPLLQMALTCLHDMMLSASHFNYFEDILKLVVHSLTLAVEEEVLKSSKALKQLFACDEQGQSTFLTLRLLSNTIKDLEYDCPPTWLISLEAVRIRSDITARATPKTVGGHLQHKKKHMSAQQKKDHKAKQEELKKMAEAEEMVSQDEMKKWASESIKYLFRIYFGILKNNPEAELLPAVLTGLAKHAHRINVEYFAALLQSLKALLDDKSKRPDLLPALHCILTVDRIYAINENLSGLDLKFFYNALYTNLAMLTRTPLAWSWDQIQSPLKDCLRNLFHPKRHLPSLRVAGFSQRLIDLACAFTNNNMHGPAIFILEHVKDMLTHHTGAQSVLDKETFGQGTYSPTCEDPDLCNPFTRSLHPILCALKLKEVPRGKINALVNDILKLSPLQQ